MTPDGRKAQAIELLEQRIARVEGSADRAVRELILATPGSSAHARMQAIEEAVAPLRAQIALIRGAAAEELDQLLEGLSE